MEYTNESYDMPDNLPMTDISDFSTESPGSDDDVMGGGFVPWLGSEKPKPSEDKKPSTTSENERRIYSQFIETMLQSGGIQNLNNSNALHNVVNMAQRAKGEEADAYYRLAQRLIDAGVDPKKPNDAGQVVVSVNNNDTSEQLSMSGGDADQNMSQLSDSVKQEVVANALKNLFVNRNTFPHSSMSGGDTAMSQLSDSDQKTVVAQTLKNLFPSAPSGHAAVATSEAGTIGFNTTGVYESDERDGQVNTSDEKRENTISDLFVGGESPKKPKEGDEKSMADKLSDGIEDGLKKVGEGLQQVEKAFAGIFGPKQKEQSPAQAKPQAPATQSAGNSTSEVVRKALTNVYSGPTNITNEQDLARALGNQSGGGYDLNTEQLVQHAEYAAIDTEQLLHDVEHFIGQSGGGKKKSNKSSQRKSTGKDKGKGKRQISEGSNEIQRLIQKQSDEVHNSVLRKIQHLMSVNETTAQKYKSEIQKEVTKGKRYSDNSMLDQALAVERATTQKKLNAIKSSGKVKHPVTKRGRDAHLYEEDERSPSISPSVAHRNHYSPTNSDSYALSPTSSYQVPSQADLSTTSYTPLSPRD